MAICSKCNGTGKLRIEKPVSMTAVKIYTEDCDICGGAGQLPEWDLAPVLEKLDRIIELLEKFPGK